MSLVISGPINDNESTILYVTQATYAEDYTIQIRFNDKTEQIVDFSRFLFAATHPSIRKYLDLSLFKQFRVKDGDLMWGDMDLIFPVWDLYTGKI
jgi:hypothetical protein